MVYLSTNNGSNISSSETVTTREGNSVTKYYLDAAAAWSTEVVGIDPSRKNWAFQVVQNATVSGTGSIKLQYSVDGDNFVDVTGQTITVEAGVNSVIIYSKQVEGYLRLSNDGSASGGSVSIIWDS